MRRAALMVVWLLVSCGGDDATPKGQYSEQCSVTADCAEGLTCGQRICTIACQSTAQCSAFGSNSFCPSQGYCLDACRDAFNCPNGLSCVMQGSTQGICVPQ